MSVLEFQDVTLAPRPEYDGGIEHFTFALHPGDLLFVRVGAAHPRSPICDLAQGLVPPDEGNVLYRGENWQTAGPDDVARGRATIGRVFQSGGWLSNLDVDENVTLAQRYHTRRPASEILAEAHEWAVRFDLPELPKGRPHTVPRHELRRAQWVRAFLGKPALLLFDLPGRDLYAHWTSKLVTAVREVRAAGTAVVWITADAAEGDALNPSLKFDSTTNKMTAA